MNDERLEKLLREAGEVELPSVNVSFDLFERAERILRRRRRRRRVAVVSIGIVLAAVALPIYQKGIFFRHGEEKTSIAANEQHQQGELPKTAVTEEGESPVEQILRLQSEIPNLKEEIALQKDVLKGMVGVARHAVEREDVEESTDVFADEESVALGDEKLAEESKKPIFTVREEFEIEWEKTAAILLCHAERLLERKENDAAVVEYRRIAADFDTTQAAVTAKERLKGLE